MTISKKQTKEPQKTAIRLPYELWAEIKAEAAETGISMNSIIIARLTSNRTEQALQQLSTENAEIKTLATEILRAIQRQ